MTININKNIMKNEFKATHAWKQYPGIKFEADLDRMQIRGKGDNDSKATGWASIRGNRDGVMYFRLCGETIYWFDLEKLK